MRTAISRVPATLARLSLRTRTCCAKAVFGVRAIRRNRGGGG
jgi:hypothetical protein